MEEERACACKTEGLRFKSYLCHLTLSWYKSLNFLEPVHCI